MSLKFKYIPLTFLSDDNEIKRQIRNTIILRYFFDKNSSVVKLKNLIDNTQYGYNASALDSGQNKFLRISDITNGKVDWATVPFCNCDDEEAYLLHPNDILIARTGGTTGKSFLISSPPERSIYAGYLIRIRANSENKPEFLKLFLDSYAYWAQIVSLNEGEFRPSVNANKLKQLILPDCDITQQEVAVQISLGQQIAGYEDLSLQIEQALKEYENCKNIQKHCDIQKSNTELLKQSILQEAIQGKLTATWREQNPDIEPASKLLKRIKAEKEKLIKEKKIRKEKSLPPISEDEIPFELPEGWAWCRLGEICSKTGSGSTPKGGKAAYPTSGIKFLRSQNVYNDGLRYDGIAYISETTHEKMKGTKVEPEDLLLNITGGSIGRCCVVPKDFDTGNINQHVAIIRTVQSFLGNFVHNVICSPYFQKMIIEVQTGAGREGLPKNKMDNIVFALPPESEQVEINNRVHSLIEKCKELETEITKSEQHAQMLMQAMLKEAFEGKKETKVIELPAQEKEEKHFLKRKVLASYIINQSLDDSQFGDTKFEKLLHLADYFAIQRNLGQKYIQKAAGPYDNSFTIPFFQQVIKAKWFRKQKAGKLNKIIAGENQPKSTNTYNFFSQDELQRVNILINYFKKYDYEQPEIISTLYAVWNNRIIKNQPITDQLLKEDFLKWDEQKAKYKNRLDAALNWMRKEGIVPNGWGEVIEKAKGKKNKK